MFAAYIRLYSSYIEICTMRRAGRQAAQVMHTAGHGYRLSGKLLKEEFDRAGLVHRLLLRYTLAFQQQVEPDGGLQRQPRARSAFGAVATGRP